MKSQEMTRGAVVCIPHGGGPMPLLSKEHHPAVEFHKGLVNSLRTIVPHLLGLESANPPRALLVVSAHWSTDQPTISSGASPSLYYDYGGFPEEAYRLKYPAAGSPSVAEEVRQALEAENFAPNIDSRRGWDHGVFVPMKLINEAADVPIVALSVLRSEDSDDHIRYGAALRRLRDSNVAVIGSGFASYHNQSVMASKMVHGAPIPREAHDLFRQWNKALTDVLMTPDRDQRLEKLKTWYDLPGAKQAHPHADHFLPLLVCAGAATEEEGEPKSYVDDFLGLDISTYYWSERTAKEKN